MKPAKLLLIFLTLTLFNFLNVNAQSGFVTIKGKLKGFNNQVNIEDMSEFQYLLPPTGDRLIVPDSTGGFSIKFKVANANYYRLGRNQLYLTPGDNLVVFIDYSDSKKATFTGIGSTANSYLKNTPFPKAGSFIEAGKNIKETPGATILAVEEMAKLRSQELALVKGVSAEFRRLETARIKADLINSLLAGEGYSNYKLKLKGDDLAAFKIKYQAAIAPKLKMYCENFTDPTLLKLVVYRDIADELIKYGGKSIDIQIIKDYYASSLIVSEMQKASDKQMLAPIKAKMANIKTSTFQGAINKMYAYLMAFGKGDTAVDFTAVNDRGEKVNLSSLKGKVIYLDLWATWCGPCMEEMPSYEKLKAKYADNPNVVFVSLSIDDNEELWKGSLTQRKADGYQWIINRAKLQAYNIVGIPRSFIIDKNFKMVNMAAPLPSDVKANKEIDELVKN